MLIKDLIAKLEVIRDQEMAHYDALGEPAIYIDTFKHVPTDLSQYSYNGVSYDIKFDRTADGVFLVMSAFAESYETPE